MELPALASPLGPGDLICLEAVGYFGLSDAKADLHLVWLMHS